MKNLHLNRLPAVNIRDNAQLASMFPNDYIAGLLRSVDSATAKILGTLAPDQDPQPIAIFLGWDSKHPTFEIMEIDGRYLQNAETKEALASGLRDFVLKRRAIAETETFAVALINAAWMKHIERDASTIQTLERLAEEGLKNEPVKTEIILCDIIWQDGQRCIARAIERSPGEPPKFGDSWRDMSAGAVMVNNRFWNAIAPTLAATAYAEAIIGAFEAEKAEGEAPEGQEGGSL